MLILLGIDDGEFGLELPKLKHLHLVRTLNLPESVLLVDIIFDFLDCLGGILIDVFDEFVELFVRLLLDLVKEFPQPDHTLLNSIFEFQSLLLGLSLEFQLYITLLN